MARDIEEFLRRAAERRKQQQQQQRRPAAASSERVKKIVEDAEVEIVRQPDVPAKPKSRKQSKPRPSLRQQRDLRNESVEDHVRQHINTTAISEHAEHLGERIQFADDRISERLQKKFDHDVSKLDDLPTVQDDEAATVTQADTSHIAMGLIGMLRTPENVRQAILISEILNRPNFD